jgi:uncharacterized protein YciI
MTHYAVTRAPGQNWDPSRGMREQERWDDHAAFMDALAADGFIVLGGPLDGEREFLMIVDAEGAQEVEARFADDPWVPMGLIRIARIERWEILLRPEN